MQVNSTNIYSYYQNDFSSSELALKSLIEKNNPEELAEFIIQNKNNFGASYRPQ
jgi:hypothetical protein